MSYLKNSAYLVAGALFSMGLALGSTGASAAECPRGTLDKQYCDRDGNLTADLPLDESQWVDPDTIIFSYTPVEDPAVYEKVWDGFVKHMAEVTGKNVVFFPVQSYAAQYEAMRSGRLHIAGVNTGGNPVAVSCAGFVPFAMMASGDGSFGYEMEIIVPADSRDSDPGRPQGPHAGLHLADLQLRLQGALGPAQVRVRPDRRRGLQDHLLGQARQLDPGRRQQGLRGRRDRQLGLEAHDRPGGHQARADPHGLQVGRPSRPPATVMPTTSTRWWSPRSSRPSSPSPGRART